MPRFEYKVIPAPKKPGKIKGVKGTDQKFAVELATLMNDLGAEGWEYQRADTLPVEERQGLTGRVTTFQNMLIFRREINDLIDEPQLASVPEPVVAEPEPTLAFRRESTPALASELAEVQAHDQAPDPAPQQTFASIKIAEPEAPPLAASAQAPEGKAPTISFRGSDKVAAQ